MKHFQQIAAGLDVLPALEALRLYAAHFRDITFRQEAYGSPHPQTETIFLRMPLEITRDSIFEGMDVTDYPGMAVAPFGDLVHIIGALGGAKPARAMIVKLHPGGRIARHTDEGSYAAATERFHLPLATNLKAWLRADNETLSPPAGNVFWFNKHVPHEGANEGASDRLHLIVDLWAN